MRISTTLFLAFVASAALAQREGRPIVLGPDDKAAFPAAPQGFDKAREGVARGKIETVEYDSKSVGSKRRMLVYTPPGYSKDKRYPVLYLLHGIGGTEREWADNGAPAEILDNLLAEKRIVPMIVVMPNGRAQTNDRAEGNVFASAPAFGRFDKDLLGSVIPHIDANYATLADRDHRAIAGLSMGGGQALNFGFANPGTFGWVGGFSSAPNTLPPDRLVPDPERAKSFEMVWISCGDKDGLIGISQGVQRYLADKGVPHVWHVDSGGHTWEVWKNDLYLFSQKIFR
ncbi:MAG TPA: alpha/beta hydrolase-fold protein [Fimbriimonas sp.]